MGILNRIFGSNKKQQSSHKGKIERETTKKDSTYSESGQIGFVSTNKIELDDSSIEIVKQKYFAFDVETTGLSPYNDRIIEVGAVLFEDGVAVKRFGSLVNAKVKISAAASAVNHITDQMIEMAPSESEVYSGLVDFLGDALEEKTPICAHNANFDMKFLSETLARLGYSARINYVDTLSLSKKLIKGLANYKQDTVAAHFNVRNNEAHRALSDAEVCGGIFFNLLELAEKEKEENKIAMEKNKPSEEELEVCAFIQHLIEMRSGDTKLIGFYKNSNGYVDICCLYTIIKFKFSKKGRYIIVEKDLDCIEEFIIAPCTMSEGGADYVRLYFNSPLDLEVVGDYIFEQYKATHKSAREYLGYDSRYMIEYQNSACMSNALSPERVKEILSSVRSKEYGDTKVPVEKVEAIDRSSVEIHPINNRVPISKIRNLSDWEKGFDQGFPYYEKGESLRKAGNIEEAIELYDKARFLGYEAPALYNSYAMAYRKLKDYDNEIAILDEGIEREAAQGRKTGRMVARRNTAMNLLIKQRTRENSNTEETRK